MNTDPQGPLDLDDCRVEFFIDTDDERILGADIYHRESGQLVHSVDRVLVRRPQQ